MADNVVIIDCGSGNLRSVEKALQRAAREAGIAAHISVTGDPAAISHADRIVLPGVGAFAACMAGLEENPEIVPALEHSVLVEGRPFLGICVGMQMLAGRGLEFEEIQGLGWLPGETRRLDPAPGRRIPHVGWNDVSFEPGPLASAGGAARADDFYFVHSFHFVPENRAVIAGVCDYFGEVVAAVQRDNILGVQFHPEKSQEAGLSLLARFLAWRP